ncbi:hypothetical protein SAMN06297251_10116 [Fulvimarina manganoxydans]|uniref:Uncharacterized protein n=2 Tax=Fulvimarina manganoxydans TaxID=937218 RepID=A0A1W1Y7X7_9HYPH|nr:hypothetical protein SAMN06297251_10116 [Fulvimarina manganoxydans]
MGGFRIRVLMSPYINGIVYPVNKRYRLFEENRMGRPALDVSPTVVRLTTDQRARIEALVGKRGLAGFIRAAVEAELERRETGK